MQSTLERTSTVAEDNKGLSTENTAPEEETWDLEFGHSIDIKSGKIDRLLCEFRSEMPFLKFHESLKTLIFILRNIVNQPDEEKFRLLKSSNPKLVQHLFQYQKCTEVLSIIGFKSNDESFKMGPPDIELLERILLLLQRLKNRSQRPMPSWQKIANNVANQSVSEIPQTFSPVERNVTIFDESLGIPQNPQLVDNDSTDGDLELLSAAARDLHRRAKYAQLLVPQSYVTQQMQATSTYIRPTSARIRVRIHRHILVQAHFSSQETLRDVSDVIRTVLKDPQRQFRFVIPPATILDESALEKSLLDLKLAPSAVMYAEFSDNVELNELMTEEALQSARRIENDEPKPTPENTTTAIAQEKPIRTARSGSGKVPAWFRK